MHTPIRRRRAPLPLLCYRLVGMLSAPALRLLLERRCARGKEDRARLSERFGEPGMPRPEGPLLWVHAASVGETLSVLPVIDRITGDHPDLTVLLTTGTLTSARLAAERAPGVIHRFVPWDHPRWVRRFLDGWRPDAAIWVESELWPTLIAETAARGIPMALLNGRMSERSARRWRLAPASARFLLSRFLLCLGQSAADCERLAALGAPGPACPGNLKFAAPPLPADDAELSRLAGALEGRPSWIAASTHDGEEAVAGTVHLALAPRHRGLLTVVAPRHPQRGAAVAAALSGMGLNVARRSLGEVPTARTDIYVADTVGELGLFYRLCGAVFVGKSLVALGGQNPLEPARLGRAVLHGPHMANFAEVVEAMTAAGASRTVADAEDLARLLSDLLDDPALRERWEDQARRFAEERAAGVLDGTLARLAPLLERLSHRRR